MELYVKRPMLDLRGKEIKQDNGKDAETALLGHLCVNALLADVQADNQAPANLKIKRWNLAKRINKALENDLMEADAPLSIPTDDVALIKQRMALIYPTPVLGPAYEAIEGSEQDSE